jgi:hypothetical protein
MGAQTALRTKLRPAFARKQAHGHGVVGDKDSDRLIYALFLPHKNP